MVNVYFIYLSINLFVVEDIDWLMWYRRSIDILSHTLMVALLSHMALYDA